jgi:3-isopropylmalate/(R)-2-methylmalate dehydratase small subunit
MDAFTVVRGPAAPLMLPDINTDVLYPGRAGKGDLALDAFGPLRYLPDGSENPSFVLNQDRFRGAPILLAAQNFGCGSSREHAVWALRALGIRCVIAISFGDIFCGNCFQNGMLPIVLDDEVVHSLAEEAESGEPLEVNLLKLVLTSPRGNPISFAVNPTRRLQLLEGLDDLDLGLRRRDQIKAFQRADRQKRPWVYEIPGLALREGVVPNGTA